MNKKNYSVDLGLISFSSGFLLTNYKKEKKQKSIFLTVDAVFIIKATSVDVDLTCIIYDSRVLSG